MSTAAIVQIVLMAISAGITLEQHGKPKTGNHSFWSWLFAAGVQAGILYWGGFFGVQ